MICNICGNQSFVDFNNRKGVRCEKCNSLERTRLFWMYLNNIKLDSSKAKILHIAPEQGIYNVFSRKFGKENYIVADLFPEKYSFAENCVRMDLCDLDNEKSEEFDLIIHCHVLEHIPCNIAYTLFHLHRMLKKDGLHICIIPFMSGNYDECFQGISREERIRRFGQHDHVRRFGRDDLSSHLGSILNLPKKFDARENFSVKSLTAANIPEREWSGFGTSTVLQLRKRDMKFFLDYY